jgi:glycosyltransferase involved in cell wall biosynthesis
LLDNYSEAFHIVLYTSDSKDYSGRLPVEHYSVPWLPQVFGLRHLLYFFWLVWQAPRMKGVIKVFGSNIPTLFLVKLISRCPMMVTYQFSYSELATKTWGSRNMIALFSSFFERLALQASDLVLVTTKALETRVQQVYRKPTVLLPNWVDFKKRCQPLEEERDPGLVLYAGRLHRIKGVDVLNDAFAQAKRAHQEARLLICGMGDERGRLEAQVESSGVEDVQFLGNVVNEEVLSLMNKAAIFVLPTTTMEGHPKALIEAMAYGVACIASDVPGNRDLLENEKNGLLVPPRDAPALAEAIVRLLNDDKLRRDLCRQAQIDANVFDSAVIVPKEIQCLLELGNQRIPSEI